MKQGFKHIPRFHVLSSCFIASCVKFLTVLTLYKRNSAGTSLGELGGGGGIGASTIEKSQSHDTVNDLEMQVVVAMLLPRVSWCADCRTGGDCWMPKHLSIKLNTSVLFPNIPWTQTSGGGLGEQEDAGEVGDTGTWTVNGCLP